MVSQMDTQKLKRHESAQRNLVVDGQGRALQFDELHFLELGKSPRNGSRVGQPGPVQVNVGWQESRFWIV